MVCRRCGLEKSSDEMQVDSRRGKLKQHCIECERRYKREWHQRHKSRRMPLIRAADKAAKLIKRKWLYDYLSQHPCVECGESNPVVLEFNHRDREQKLFAIANGICRYAMDVVRAEVAKCDVMCANCHRRLTAKQLGWYSWLNEASGSTPAG